MKRGVEIRLEDIREKEGRSNRHLTDIFVEIPQVTEVIESVEQGLDDLQRFEVTTVKIVYGDYGHGKSQTAHIALEKLVDRSDDIKRLIHLENISSYRSFIDNIADNMETQLLEYDEISTIEEIKPLLFKLHKSSESEQTLSEITTTLVELLTILSKNNYNIIIFLDEVDKITHDSVDMTEWIDFFTTINDARDLRLFLMLFMPQNVAHELMEKDTRMLRWEQAFELEAIFLDGRFGKDVLEGIANILALSALYNKTDIKDRDLQFVYDAFKYRQDYIVNSSIRKTNMWSLTTSEILNHCKDENVWTKLDEFKERKPETQEFLLGKQISHVFIKDKFPNFDVHIDDSEDKETYRLEFNTESLVSSGNQSDGHFKLYRRSSSSEFHDHSIGLVIESTLERRNYEKEIINKIISLSESYPIIFFSVGLSKKEELDLQQQFDRLADKYIQYYPVLVVNIIEELLAPLILVPAKHDKEMRKLRSIIKAWGTTITDHRNKIEQFLNTIPEKMVDRTVRLKTYKLIGSTRPDKKIAPEQSVSANDDTAAMLQSLTDDPVIGIEETDGDQYLINAGKFFGASLVAIVDSIKSYKYKSTIEKEVKKMMNRSEYRDQEMVFFNRIQEFYDTLVDNEMIEFDRRGGKQIVRKTSIWNDEVAVKYVHEIFE